MTLNVRAPWFFRLFLAESDIIVPSIQNPTHISDSLIALELQPTIARDGKRRVSAQPRKAAIKRIDITVLLCAPFLDSINNPRSNFNLGLVRHPTMQYYTETDSLSILLGDQELSVPEEPFRGLGKRTEQFKISL
jgi:hypothetical protein